MRMNVVVSAEDAEEEKKLYGSMKEQIRRLIAEGKDREEVMEKTKCTEQYYYKVKKEMENEETK